MEAVVDAEAVLEALVEANAAQELIDLAEKSVDSAKKAALGDALNLLRLSLKLLACQLSCTGGSDSGSCG